MVASIDCSPNRSVWRAISISSTRSGSASTAETSWLKDCRYAVRQGSPSATQLPKKISAKDSPTNALIPQPINALSDALIAGGHFKNKLLDVLNGLDKSRVVDSLSTVTGRMIIFMGASEKI